MVTQATYCPDCENGEWALIPYPGAGSRTCKSCGAVWPTAQQQQDLLDALFLAELDALVEYRVYCRWVPGTMDRVEMWLGALGERWEVKIDWVRQQVGHRAIHELYLQGKTEFGCDLGFWQRAKAQPCNAPSSLGR
ncbi:hypothetical protein [Meiothermus sp.]|uniref:hypothetical protein n=1 Tax=Meiothermus sp. TaxID=1955249 RepID=UPI00307F6771